MEALTGQVWTKHAVRAVWKCGLSLQRQVASIIEAQGAPVVSNVAAKQVLKQAGSDCGV